MTNNERINGMIGMAKAGGYVLCGENLAHRLTKRRIPVIILASDISGRAMRNLKTAMSDDQITIEYCTKEELGHLISARPVNAIGINSAGIARKIIDLRKEK